MAKKKRKKKERFVHLHNHTEFSCLDALPKCMESPELEEFLGASAFQAYAITDHGTMGGVVKFHKACEKAKVQPIIGCEIYMADDMEDVYTREVLTRWLIKLLKRLRRRRLS